LAVENEVKFAAIRRTEIMR